MHECLTTVAQMLSFKSLTQITCSSKNHQHPLCWLTLVSVCLGVSSIWELGWAWASVGWRQASQLALWATQAWGAQLNSQGFLWAWSSFWFSLRSWVSTGSLLPSFCPQNKHPNISTTRSVLYVAAGGKKCKMGKNCKNFCYTQDEISEGRGKTN